MASASPIPSPDPNSPAWNLYIDTQPFNLTGLDGSQVTFTLSDVNANTYFVAAQTAITGFSVGFTGMLMIVLLILTDAKKCRRPIFIVNFINLFLLCLRSVLVLAASLKQEWYGFGEAFFPAYHQYAWGPIRATSTTIYILNIVLYGAILASLIMQVRIVFAAEPRTQMVVTVVLTLVALLIEAFWIYFNVFQFIYLFDPESAPSLVAPLAYKFTERGLVAFVGVGCLVFLCKLFLTIQRRRKMGFRQFGPLHILFIMIVQTLLIPRTSSFLCKLLMSV
jgi:pheromone alpha factor receptor